VTAKQPELVKYMDMSRNRWGL